MRSISLTKIIFVIGFLQISFCLYGICENNSFDQVDQVRPEILQASFSRVQEILELPAGEFWISVAAVLLVVFLRIVPTAKNYDIIHLLVRILDFLIPNRATGDPASGSTRGKAKFSISKVFKSLKN